MAKKPLKIDMIAGSQLRDTQGEMLSVEGADITDLVSGRGRLNDNHGKGFFNSIGRVTGAKKIFKAEDCENDRHSYYWNKIKAPYIYVEGELFDDEDHPNARAAAAILRNIHKTESPLQLKASVEGGVVARGTADPSLLARTKIHSVALTFTPANNNTLVEPVSLDKSVNDEKTDMLLIKSVMHLAQNNVPSFRHIVRDASATRVQDNLIRLTEIMKTMGIEKEFNIPSKEFIINKSLEHKVANNIRKINEIVKVFDSQSDEDLEKNIRNILAGAALGTTLAGSSPQYEAPKVETEAVSTSPAETSTTNVQPTHQDVLKQVTDQFPLLGAIAHVESSGGTRFGHKTVRDPASIHNGHTAGGMFGMMPHAAAFALKKDSDLANKYPDLVEAAKDIDKNHRVFTDRFNNDPQAAADFAISTFIRNKGKTKNDHMLIYSWLNGLKGSWNKYRDNGMEWIKNHGYVNKVMDALKQIDKSKDQQKQGLDLTMKSLTAGYGGAGAPNAMVGGSVLQSESLEDGRPKFKYINCDNCGKEQIYAKYQVKCRECGHSFSLDKLLGAMQGTKNK